MYMTRGATGSAGYEQIRDKSTYYKNYYKNNKERLKRHKQKRIDQQKRQNDWLKSQGVILLYDPELIKEQKKLANKIEREKVRNYRRIRYQATKQYYVDYYQKNKHIIKQKRIDKQRQSNLTGADAYAIGGDS